MTAMHAYDVVFNEADDDDGMPPLVDNPIPSMTFTFATDMTPITYSADPTSFEFAPESGAPADMAIYSPPTSPVLGATRVSHAKKRDASYIPRPPNAFILFRSSFIRAQHIPGKIEGNHSALSKIIGKYWKALPREEREVWEAKAIVAQAEHRKRYPDWRFRPGANALAKVKDGPKRRSNRKGRGEAEKEERSREKRCAKIADLLVAGKTGSDLEAAIEEYDCAAGGVAKVKEEGYSSVDARAQEGAAGPGLPNMQTRVVEVERAIEETPRKYTAPADARSKTPGPALDGRFKVPLTAMFKRSSSAPASHSRSNSGCSAEIINAPADPGAPAAVDAPSVPNATYANYLTSPPGKHEDEPRVDTFIGTAGDGAGGVYTGSMSAMQPAVLEFYDAGRFSPFGDGARQWDPAYAASPVDSSSFSPLPSFDSDTESFSSPYQSPSSVPFTLYDGDGLANRDPMAAFNGMDRRPCDDFHSSYSSLKGWAGDAFSKCGPANPSLAPPFVVPPGTDSAIMRDAFEAATTAVYGDWCGNTGLVIAPLGHTYYQDTNFSGADGLQCYAQVQALNCRPDNRGFFN